MIKLSIIVPVYGVAPYLRKCVDSLLNQDIPSSEYEIILVDDESPDACPQICDEYDTAYDNIRVVHRKNGGLSAARNSGLEIAQGEYLMFVDSDDYIEPNVLGSLVAKMDADKLDILRFNFQNVNEYYEVFNPYKSSKPYTDYRDEVVDGETFLNECLGIACYAWQFILRRDLIVSKENSNLQSEISNPKNILFKEKIYFEDTEWAPRILLQANRVTSVDIVVYNYLWRKGSITLPTNPEKLHKVLVDKIALIEGFRWQRDLAKNPQWFTWMTSVTTLSVLSILTAYPLREQRRYIAQLRALGVFPLTTYHASGNMLRKTHLANISPLLYCWVLGKLNGAYWDNLVKHLYAALNVLRLWPHLLLFLFSPRRRMIRRDMMAYRAEYGKGHLLWFLTYNKSFRGLFYYRIGNNLSMLIRWLAPTVHELTFSPQVQVGEGVLLFHAYCTILNAHRIGDHCRILHMVTLGDKNGKVPTIGNHVEILPGATIVGGITIGDNCVIGPGAVVFKSVPANCVVVGNPAYILKRDGIVVNEKL